MSPETGTVPKSVKLRIESRMRIIAWTVGIVFGLIQAWSDRFSMLPDGISYLDIADNIVQRNWSGAVNAYWSPLYSWLLAAGFYVLRPSAYWEYPVVHLINFVVYLISFACFEFLLSQIISYQQRVQKAGGDSSLPSWAWQCVGYVLFLWSALFLIGVSEVTPDMAVAALVFCLGGLLIRIRRQPDKLINYIGFGIALGVAYLAKAVMFPLGFVFLGILFFPLRNWRKALPRILVASVMFLLVSAPFIVALHNQKNRWTFGDSGKLAYAWLIEGTEPYIHWQGNPPEAGVPAHTTRKIFDVPAVYEFKEPFKVTYSPWFDPTYWNEGMIGHFNAKGQLRVLFGSTLSFYAILINSSIGVSALMSFLVLILYKRPRAREWRAGISLLNLILPALAAFAIYALVHVQSRYLGAFVVLFWLGMFSSVRLSPDRSSHNLLRAVVIALVAVSMTVMTAKSVAPAGSVLRDLIGKGNSPSLPYWPVADGLAKLGLQPGDQIGSIAYGFAGVAYSARLAKLNIVAEICTGTEVSPKDDVDKFWHTDPETQRRVIEAFKSTGAKAIVANRLPPGLAAPAGWQRIGSTDHFVYLLK